MSPTLFSKLGLLGILVCLVPSILSAQELHQDIREIVSATVIEVVSEEEHEVAGTDITTSVQELRVILTSGEQKGEVRTFMHEVVPLEVGDKIFLNHVVSIEGNEYYSYADFERRPVLLVLALIFVVVLVFFAGRQGVRALLSLAASVAAICFILVPALLHGYDPALTVTALAAVILAVVLFGTHGRQAKTVIAYGGTMAAVVITALIALVSVKLMRLSGFSDDASVYLNFATDGALDLSGLLLGSIIIGILGILDDVAMTQASVVQELKAANPLLTVRELYERAIKVGRDHIGSLVNTLALAYVGVALPLILLFAKTETDLLFSLSREVVAVEFLRIIVGSIGLILAVPTTTLVAAWYFAKHGVDENSVSTPRHHHHH